MADHQRVKRSPCEQVMDDLDAVRGMLATLSKAVQSDDQWADLDATIQAAKERVVDAIERIDTEVRPAAEGDSA